MKTFLRYFLVLLFGLGGLTASAQVVFIVESPSSLAGGYDFTYADTWGANMDTVALTAEAAFAYDASATEDSLACGNIVNTADITGKIAVLYRGECNFSLKAKNVQDSGAVACIIINNIPGAPVGMAGGTVGDDVTIPVVMISNVDGALLRDSILAGGVTIYMGNNTGVFEHNVGIYASNAGIAQNFATPTSFVSTDGELVRLGVWSYNYGSEEATGVTVTAQILQDGTEVFTETSASADVPALGDSAYFSFAEFLATAPGFYTLTYTITADSTDAYPSDNKIETNFWINAEGYYSKSRIDPVDGPINTGSLQPAVAAGASFEEWEYCTALRSEGSSDQQITGITFAASTGDTTISLIGKSVFVKFYEWNDVGVSFNDMVEMTSNEIYDFSTNASNEFVTHEFADPIDIVPNQNYLSCIFIDDEELYLAYDNKVDYSLNYNELFPDKTISPLFTYNATGGTAYSLGFGLGTAPSIITNVFDPNGIAEDVEALDVTPYPNPTTDMINIPLGSQVSGKVVVNAYDMGGRLVLNEVINQNTNNLRVDVSSLTSGMHTFSLTFEDDSRTSFRVVVTK